MYTNLELRFALVILHSFNPSDEGTSIFSWWVNLGGGFGLLGFGGNAGFVLSSIRGSLKFFLSLSLLFVTGLSNSNLSGVFVGISNLAATWSTTCFVAEFYSYLADTISNLLWPLLSYLFDSDLYSGLYWLTLEGSCLKVGLWSYLFGNLPSCCCCCCSCLAYCC